MGQLSQRFRNSLPLLLLPMLWVGVAIGIGQQKGPYWLGFRLDPEYAYLVNSLSLALGKPPGHIDHPGTPIQILGGIVLRLVHRLELLFSPNVPSLEVAVLQRPEHYLAWLNLACVGLIGLTLLLVGITAYRSGYGLTTVLLLQATPGLTVSGLATMNRFTPEPVIFAITQLLVMMLLLALNRDKLVKSQRFALVLGGILGLGLACKITFLPMLVLLMVLSGFRLKCLGLLATIAAFLISTLPIVPQYPKVFFWFLDITLHKGNYGGGDRGLINWTTIWPSVTQMFKADPVFFLWLGVAGLGYLVISVCPQLKPSPPREANPNLPTSDRLSLCVDRPAKQPYQLLGLLWLAICGQLVMTLKHPIPFTVSDIELRYLMPAIGLVSLLLVVTIVACQQQVPAIFQQRWINFGGIALLALCLILNARQIVTTLQGMKTYQQEVTEVLNQLDTQYPQCIRINYYRSSSVEYALYFGNDYTQEHFSATLEKLYPTQQPRLFYHFWRKTFETFTQKVANQPPVMQELLSQRCILLQGSPIRPESAEQHFPGASLKKLTDQTLEQIYRLQPAS